MAGSAAVLHFSGVFPLRFDQGQSEARPKQAVADSATPIAVTPPAEPNPPSDPNPAPALPLPETVAAELPADVAIYSIVEVMPVLIYAEYQGDEGLAKFIADNLAYPGIAKENRIEGMVVVKVIVEIDGSVSDATLLRNIGGGTGVEALRLARMMRFIPGRQDGRPVRVAVNMPIKFKLS